MAIPIKAAAERTINIRLKRILMISSVAVILAASLLIMNLPSKGGKQFRSPASADTLHEPVFASRNENERTYGRVLADGLKKGYPDYEGADVSLDIGHIAQSSGKVEKQTIEGKQAVVTDGLDSWVEWEFEAPESAMYQIDMGYLPLDGKKSSAERALMIDGKRPFKEASRFSFQRYWQEQDGEKYDSQGNQIRSLQNEIRKWRIKPMEHPEKFYNEAYRFYFEKGKHAIRLIDVREPMAVSSIVLHKPVVLAGYEEIAAGYLLKGYKKAEGAPLKFQTEIPLEASELSLRAEWNDDPHSEPKAIQKTNYNVFGGARWKLGGQNASWEFDVQESGLYEFAFRYAVPIQNQVAHRTIRIDGEVPFKEMQEYVFPAIQGWYIEPLKDENNEPYQFYLTQGKHVITVEGTLGPIRQVTEDITNVIDNLSELSQDVVKITASSKDANGKITTDRNQDWNLERYIPNLVERLNTAAGVFERSYALIRESNGGKMPSYGQSLQTAISMLNKMAGDTEEIPYMLNEVGTVSGALGTTVQSLKEQPLYFDYMLASPPGTDYPSGYSSFLENMEATAVKFSGSFNKDSAGQDAAGDEKVLKVWVARGREWTDIIKSMILEDFTPRTGIRVEINTVPLGSEHLLLLAYTGGKAPDVALGVTPNIPVEFSVRGAVVDLNSFPDVDEVKQRFIPEALVPLAFNGGLYAIPETVDFNLLFYREDILNRIGTKPPQTWQEVYALLPRLQEEGMSFYYPAGPGGYTPFLFQHGGSFYSKDGLKSELNTPEALSAFKEWTNLFNNYKMPLQADFYQRFRNGEMPIGIGNYDFYVKLSTSAPELNGRWKMIPLPGIEREDGVIDRSASGAGAVSALLGTTAQTGLIMSSTKYKQESWELLKWWMSEETQERFGLEVESMVGVGSRWNSANVEAIKGMAWSRDQLDAILEQWKWLREQPVVLGGYYTQRHITNAWNKAVLLGDNERIALEDAVKEINKELTRKREEYNTMIRRNDGTASAAFAEGEDQP
ncbi:extracellular solute-binding protein [Paenibacillus nasutitermitis]|uniref:ABC transporter substrate-binding protein n=1 Tax=Paenibacillus nasutitermitis TaxID=1652958 RepID=A0A916YN87_9BACL|nr:extracellular solute-binding protein [Paenibacillus nasutitermitis]GGD51170.1 ABC transporter substrate-binding protein [Paenibacillus nasutitermitis]